MLGQRHPSTDRRGTCVVSGAGMNDGVLWCSRLGDAARSKVFMSNVQENVTLLDLLIYLCCKPCNWSQQGITLVRGGSVGFYLLSFHFKQFNEIAKKKKIIIKKNIFTQVLFCLFVLAINKSKSLVVT